MSTATPKKNKLNMQEQFAVAAHLRTMTDELSSGKLSFDSLTASVSKKLGFVVTRPNIESILGAAGIEYKPKPAPTGPGSVTRRKLIERFDEIERQLSEHLKLLDSLAHRIQLLEDLTK